MNGETTVQLEEGRYSLENLEDSERETQYVDSSNQQDDFSIAIKNEDSLTAITSSSKENTPSYITAPRSTKSENSHISSDVLLIRDIFFNILANRKEPVPITLDGEQKYIMVKRFQGIDFSLRIVNNPDTDISYSENYSAGFIIPADGLDIINLYINDKPYFPGDPDGDKFLQDLREALQELQKIF